MEGAEEEKRNNSNFAGGETLKCCIKWGVTSLGRSLLAPPPPPNNLQFVSI